MRPDQRWFPTNRTERAAWFRNFADRFSELGLSLGFTQAEIDSVNADNAVLQFSATAIIMLEAQMQAAREFDRLVTGGPNNGGPSEFPQQILPPAPPMVTTGIFARLEFLVRRIRVSPTYTETAGALLGINRSNDRLERPEQFVPKIKAAPAANPYAMTVSCAVRHFNGFEVSVSRRGSAVWESAGLYSSSPATVTIKPTTPDIPEVINVRVRMLEGFAPISQFSSIATVTVSP